jgi:hypothetical protein
MAADIVSLAWFSDIVTVTMPGRRPERCLEVKLGQVEAQNLVGLLLRSKVERNSMIF